MKSLLAKLLGISKGLLDFLLPILRDQAAASVEKLLPLALGIVVDLARGNMENDEKKAVAFGRLANAAREEGIAAGTNVINLAVEMAVARMKAEALQ